MIKHEKYMSIRIDEATKKKLERLAAQNDRTLAGEVRIAIRAHVNGERKANP